MVQITQDSRPELAEIFVQFNINNDAPIKELKRICGLSNRSNVSDPCQKRSLKSSSFSLAPQPS
jgi:hypothetical protein